MSTLTDRLPTVDRSIIGGAPGPRASRPFGLDFMTRPVPVVTNRTLISVDPQSQLSLVAGTVYIDGPQAVDASCCNTESDGQTIISVDTDENDD